MSFKIKFNVENVSIILLIIGLIVLITLPFIEPFNGSGKIDEAKAANFGSFVGGYIGSFILLLSVVILVFTLSAQKKSAQIQQFETKFFDLIKLHRENVAELYLKNRIKREVFIILHKEFLDIYFIVKRHLKLDNDNDNVKIKANISYNILFYGIGSTSTPMVKELLLDCNEEDLGNIIEEISKSNIKNGYKDLPNLKEFKLENYCPFNGHQFRLSHYFRHLFQIVEYVDNQQYLTKKQKEYYINTLSAQLSNHELAVFFYNSLSKIGKKWSDYEGKNFIEDYQLLKNIPLKGFTSDLNPEFFYNQDFEWHEIKTRP